MQSHISVKFKFKCIVGILPFERENKQRLVIKLKAKSSEFLDYALLVKLVKKEYKKQKFYTLEESLETVGLILKQKFPALYFLKIASYKPDIIKNARVGVKIKKKFKVT